MRTRLITTEEELVRLQSDWDVLVRSNPDTDMPFYGWDWFYRSWLHFSKPEGHGLFIVAVYDGEQIAGLLPLVRRVRKSMKITCRLLSFCNVGMMPRNTIYTDPQSDQEKIFQAAWEHLFNERSNWDMIELANVPETMAFHNFVLKNQSDTSSALIRLHGLSSPRLVLTGTLDDYLQSLDKKLRYNIKRYVKIFETETDTHEVKIFQQPEHVEQAVELLGEVRKESWKGDYTNQHYPAFFRAVLPILFERHESLVLVIFYNDIPIGASFRLLKNGTYYGFGTDFKQQYKENSPGVLMFYYLIKYMTESGGRVFDFCGSDYDYKKQYTSEYTHHSTFQIFHRGWKSKFLYYVKTFWLPMVRKILHKSEPKDFVSKTKRF